MQGDDVVVHNFISSKPILQHGKGQAIYDENYDAGDDMVDYKQIKISDDSEKLPVVNINKYFVKNCKIIESMDTETSMCGYKYPELKGFCVKLSTSSITYYRLCEVFGDSFTEGLSLPRKFLVDLSGLCEDALPEKNKGNVELLCEEIYTLLDEFIVCENAVTNVR